MLQPFGLFPVPKLLRGQYEGRSYPSAYTSFDRLQFRLFSGLARQFYEPLLARMGERPSIDMFNDDAFLHGVPSYTDLLCDAGFRLCTSAPTGMSGVAVRYGSLVTFSMGHLLAVWKSRRAMLGTVSIFAETFQNRLHQIIRALCNQHRSPLKSSSARAARTSMFE